MLFLVSHGPPKSLAYHFGLNLSFQIRNDGSPIVLGLSHGWHQGEGLEGWISITVSGVS